MKSEGNFEFRVPPEQGDDEAAEEKKFFDEIPDSDAVLVLAGGLEKRGDRVVLDIESKMRALGALELWEHGKIKKIVLAGGKGVRIEGPVPPISEVMKEYLMAHGAPEEDIIIETNSINTSSSLENVLPMLEGQGIKKFLLETNEYHMGRSEQLLKNVLAEQGIAFNESLSVTAEELLRNRSSHYEKLIRAYEFPESLKSASTAAIKKGLREFLRRSLIAIDPHDKVASFLARKFRN